MKKSIFGTAALTFAFVAVAAAQNAPNPAVNPGSQKVAPPLEFSSLDINKDGRVSRDEVKSHADLTTSFGTLDSDRDTYLSESEFGKWHPSHDAGPNPPSGSKAPPSGMSPPANGAPQSSPDKQ